MAVKEEPDVELDESAYSSSSTQVDHVEAAALLTQYDDGYDGGHDVNAYSAGIKTTPVKPRWDLGFRSGRSLLVALYGSLFGLLSEPQSSTRSVTPSPATKPTPQGFWPFIRWVFNYPEPGLRLRRTAWLDALRGLAAFNVFIFHWSEEWMVKDVGWGDDDGEYNNPDAWWGAPFIRIIYDGGSAAVSLFFAISGYALSVRILGLIRQQQTDEILNSLSSSVIRRGIRLYLPVAILTFFLMNWARVTGWPLARVIDLEETYLAELWRWYLQLTHLWMPVRGQQLNIYDGTVSWTIPLEFYGSIVLWVGMLFTARITSFPVRATLFILTSAMYVVTDEWYVPQFFMGAIYAEYQMVCEEQRQRRVEISGPARPPRRSLGWRVGMIVLTVVGLYLSSMPGHWTFLDKDTLQPRPFYNWLIPPRSWYSFSRVDRYIWDIGADCLLIAVGETECVKRLLERRPFQYLGRISFGLYLCHLAVRGLMMPLDDFYLRLWGLGGTIYDNKASLAYAGAFWTRILVGAPVLFFFAGLFERWADRPSVNMGRRFENFLLRIGRRTAS